MPTNTSFVAVQTGARYWVIFGLFERETHNFFGLSVPVGFQPIWPFIYHSRLSKLKLLQDSGAIHLLGGHFEPVRVANNGDLHIRPIWVARLLFLVIKSKQNTC